MAHRKLTSKLTYRHCSEIGVDDDYCILYAKRENGSRYAVATCHTSVIPAVLRDGIKEHLHCIKLVAA